MSVAQHTSGSSVREGPSGKPAAEYSIVLLLVRLAVAIPFIYHGAGILFDVFGGPGIHGFAAFMHFPFAVAALVGVGEFFGGLGVLFGVLTRLAAAGIFVIMVGAIFIVHLPHGYSVANGGFEYPLTHVILTIALMIAGAGAITAWGGIGRSAPNAKILQ